MKNTIVLYYSKNGSNEYLAHKIAQELHCDIEKIRPRINWFLLLLLSSRFNFSAGIRTINHPINNYETVILSGPIWMGQFLSPMRDFIIRYKNKIQNLHFVTCCGSSEDDKNGKFGYETVFAKIKEVYGDKPLQCTALPISLVLPEDKVKDADTVMKTRLSDENFEGEILNQFNTFINNIKILH